MLTPSAPPLRPGGDLTQDEINWALTHPDEAAAALGAGDAEDSLIDFGEYIWETIDPAAPFMRGWAIDGLAEHLEAVTAGQIDKLLLNVPPGFGKSRWTDQIWPAWEWGPKNRPWTKYFCASYGQHLTERNNDMFRRVIASDPFQYAWGDRFELTKDSVGKVENDKTGFKFATSVGGVATGERGHRIVIDDPHNVKEAESDPVRKGQLTWFAEVMPTRLIPVPQGYAGRIPRATVIIMQRVHEEDISGKILSDARLLGYEHFCIEMEFDPDHPNARKRRSMIGWRDPRADRYEAKLTERRAVAEQAEGIAACANDGLLHRHPGVYLEALAMLATLPEVPPMPLEGELAWPELHTEEAVEDLKETLRSEGGDYAIAGQLQQQPTSRKGGMFTKDKIQVKPAHLCPRPGRMARGWDLAGSTTSRSPYTAGAMGCIVDGTVYVWDMVRRRIDSKFLESFITSIARQDGTHVEQDLPQDPGQAGKAQVRAIVKALQGYRVWFNPETGSKDDRAKPLSAQCEADNLVLVEGPWNKECIAELGSFPASRWKDQVDAMSRMYSRLLVGRATPPPAGGFIVQLPTFDSSGGY